MEILKMQPNLDFETLYHEKNVRNEANQASFQRFQTLGLPNRKLEEWKYTSFEAVGKLALEVASNNNYDLSLFDDVKFVFENSLRVYFYNGELVHCDDGLSDIFSHDDIRMRGDDHNALVALNGALADKRYSYNFTKENQPAQPIEIIHKLSENHIATQDLIFQAGEGCDIMIIEHYISDKGAFQNNQLSVIVENSAQLAHHVLQLSDDQAFHYNHVTASVHENATYRSFTLNKGAKLSRREVISHSNGEEAEISVSGVNLVDGDRLSDITLETLHNVAHGRSRQHFKTVLKESATGVFQGKIFVERDAQKTDGYQMNNALLLSDKAQMNSKPQLEIYADDVKCSHGATTGQMDESALFYLRSRGLNKEQARNLLVHAFIGEAIADIQDETVSDYVRSVCNDWI